LHCIKQIKLFWLIASAKKLISFLCKFVQKFNWEELLSKRLQIRLEKSENYPNVRQNCPNVCQNCPNVRQNCPNLNSINISRNL
jgi:hypothetical protein